MRAKELAIVLPYVFDSDLQYNLEPGLHIVVRVVFLARDQYLRSLIPGGQLEKHVIKPLLAILTTSMETRLKTRLETCLQWLLRSLQLEETEQLITMPVKLAML